MVDLDSWCLRFGLEGFRVLVRLWYLGEDLGVLYWWTAKREGKVVGQEWFLMAVGPINQKGPQKNKSKIKNENKNKTQQ